MASDDARPVFASQPRRIRRAAAPVAHGLLPGQIPPSAGTRGAAKQQQQQQVPFPRHRPAPKGLLIVTAVAADLLCRPVDTLRSVLEAARGGANFFSRKTIARRLDYIELAVVG